MNALLGDSLAQSRKAKGLSQEQMAKKLASALKQTYSMRQYQKLEKGEFPKYKTEVIKEIDKILGTNFHVVIYEQNPHKKETLETFSSQKRDFKEEYLNLLEQQNKTHWSESLRILRDQQSILTALFDKVLEMDSKLEGAYKSGGQKGIRDADGN